MNRKKIQLIPYYFVLFFIFIIILDSIFVYLAFSSHTGLVSENSYEKGLNYNDIISQKEKQDKLNWITVTKIENKNLIFQIKSEDNIDFSNAEIKAKFSSPLNDKNDFEKILILTKKNIFSSHIIFPHKGLWDVGIFVNLDSNFYQNNQRFLIK